MEPSVNLSSEDEISFKKQSNPFGTIVFKTSENSQVTFQTRTIVLNEGTEILIRRHDEGDKTDKTTENLLFTCKVMSNVHAKLRYSQGKFYIYDNNSTNGSFITRKNNDKLRLEVEKSYTLNTGDILQFGHSLIGDKDGERWPCLRSEIQILEDHAESKSNLEIPNESEKTTKHHSPVTKSYQDLPPPFIPNLECENEVFFGNFDGDLDSATVSIDLESLDKYAIDSHIESLDEKRKPVSPLLHFAKKSKPSAGSSISSVEDLNPVTSNHKNFSPPSRIYAKKSTPNHESSFNKLGKFLGI